MRIKLLFFEILLLLFYSVLYSQNLPLDYYNFQKKINENSLKNIGYNDLLSENQLNNSQEAIYKEIGKISEFVNSISINHAGTLLAAGYTDGTIRLWSLAKFGTVKSFKAHNSKVSLVEFSNNDLIIASAGEDKTVMLWDAPTGNLQGSLTGHTDIVNSIAFSKNGLQLATTSNDKTIKIWDLLTKRIITTLNTNNTTINSVEYSYEDSKLVAAGDSSIKIFSTNNWTIIRELKEQNSFINAAKFFRDNNRVVFISNDNHIKVWDIYKDTAIQISENQKETINFLKFSIDGSMFYSGGYDGYLRTWSEENYSLLKTTRCNGFPKAITIDGKRMASILGEIINISNMETNQLLGSLSGHTSSIYCIALSNDGKLLATAGWDNTVKIWDIISGELLSTFFGHTGGILSIAFSPDGERLITGDINNIIKVWAVKSGSLLYEFKENQSFIWSLCFSNDNGSLITSGSWDNTVRIWETATGKLLSTYPNAGSSVAFVPNSKKLLTAGFGMLKLWDVTNNSLLKDFSNYAGDILSLSISPNGNYFTTGTLNRSLNIWDLNTFTINKSISNFSYSIISADFSLDASHIVTSGSYSIDLYDTKTGNILRNLIMDYGATSVKFNFDASLLVVPRDRHIRLYNIKNLLLGATISGEITENGSPLKNVYVTLDGIVKIQTTTDQNGHYSFLVSGDGVFRLSPSLFGYTFSPPFIDIDNINIRQSYNFSAKVNKLILNGTVLNENKPVSNVIINLNGSDGSKISKTTDASGNYSFTIDANKSYNITPQKTGYIFNPTIQYVPYLENNIVFNFTCFPTTSSLELAKELPKKSTFFQNFPNPFNPSTTLKYNIASSGNISIKIYNTLGQEIETIINSYHQPGEYFIVWEPKNIRSGVYYCRFSTQDFNEVKKIIYIK
jgi:WD40 repeat protein